MDTALHESLAALETKLSALLGSITSSPTAAGAPTAALALLEADDTLSSTLHTLRVHQTNYARILRLRAETRGLEERIRGIVRDVGGIGDEISAARNEGCGSDSDDSDDDSESDSEDEDTRMTMDDGLQTRRKGSKEVDYKLLLDFARRISTYNVQAAADAAAGKIKPQEEKQRDPGLAAVTQEATSWLNQTANMTREASLLPYPTEDRIRMGLMGQLQAAAAEKGGDIEKELEQVLSLAESSQGEAPLPAGQAVSGTGGAGGHSVSGGTSEPGHHPHSASGTAGGELSATGTAGEQVSMSRSKPKFDLDLYDPDADDV